MGPVGSPEAGVAQVAPGHAQRGLNSSLWFRLAPGNPRSTAQSSPPLEVSLSPKSLSLCSTQSHLCLLWFKKICAFFHVVISNVFVCVAFAHPPRTGLFLPQACGVCTPQAAPGHNATRCLSTAC